MVDFRSPSHRLLPFYAVMVAEYKKISPLQYVPAVEVDGETFADSLAIIMVYPHCRQFELESEMFSIFSTIQNEFDEMMCETQVFKRMRNY